MPEHTPGLWTARNMGEVNWIIEAPEGSVPGILAQTVGGNDEANAHMLAASTALYEALKNVQWANDFICLSCKAYLDHTDDCQLAIALKQAEGGRVC